MEKTEEGASENQLAKSNLLTSLLLNLLVPISIVTIGLLVEYKSGFFEQSLQSNEESSAYHYWVLFITITLIASALFAKDSLMIWFRPHRHIREQFSFAALCTTTMLMLVLVASLLSSFMPWDIPTILIQIFRGQKVELPNTRLADYFLLLILNLLFIWMLSQQYHSWRGRKSLEQYKREQRSETSNFAIEGYREFLRLIRRGPPLLIYSRLNSTQFIPQLQPVVDSLNWKDQAKELVRLSSSSYAFDTESDWHDKENCWVGRNINTGDLVFLYPCRNDITEPELKKFLKYAKRIANVVKKRAGEIIIAAQDGTARVSNVKTDLPIRLETESSLLNNLVDFKDYFNDIRRRVSIYKLPDSDLSLNSVYVPAKFFLPNGEKQNSSLEEYLQDWLTDPNQRQLALLGEYGQGKSTTALMWTYHIITKEINSNGRIPLLIELRGTSPRNLTPLQLLGAWASQFNINPQSLMRLLIAGRLVIIFEGFDEMALVGDIEMRLKHFRTLWQFAYPNAKIIITGRPNFFLDEEEMRAALGISKPIGGRPYCEALRLAPFEPEQIKEALRAYKETVRTQIHALAEKNSRFRELVSRPSLLHIVAVLWERDRLFDKVDQLTSAFVMDLFIRHSYRRQGLKEADSPEFMALTSLEREYFMNGIAAYMCSKSLPNQISSTQLNEAITDLISVIPDSVSVDSPAISGEVTQPLRNRISNTEHGVEHVRTDVRACGLLVDDPAAPGTFRFGHKSFMEYLFAAVVAERIQDVKSEKARAVLKATSAEIENILYLSVALDFLAELLVGFIDNKHNKQPTRELSTAKKLLVAILSEKTGRYIYYRVAVFSEVITYCFARRHPPTRQMIIRMLPLIIGTTPILAWFYYSLNDINMFGRNRSWLYWGFITMTITMLMTMPQVAVRGKLRFWCRICKELGIQDKTLHKALGTSLIPWVREQPIDYYNTPFLVAPDMDGTRTSDDI